MDYFSPLILVTVLSLVSAQDVVWYISTNGSADISTCGRSIESPCISLQVILDQSELFDNGTTVCRLSGGDSDGRTSTTLYFLEGNYLVPPVCLKGWDNLSIMGLGGRVTVSSQLGAPRGFFEFVECTGVRISNIQFETAFVGKSTLYFDSSTDITISGCSFSVRVANTRGIDMIQCSGVITITSSDFTGDPDLSTQEDNAVIGLSVSHGCESSPCPTLTLQPFQLTVTDCSFLNVTSGGEPNDNYAAVRSSGTALRVRFLQGSTNNVAMFDSIRVTRTHSMFGSAVLVNFDKGSTDNRAMVINSQFMDNRVRYGGGVSTYFYSGPTNSRLDIEGCRFENNEASFEGGGVFASFLSSDSTNSIHVSDSVFVRNRALVGGAVFLFNSPNWFNPRGLFDPVSPPLVTVNLTDCTFTQNAALLKEGVLSLLRIELYVNGICLFSNSTGSALTLRSSLAFFSGHVTFLGNTGDTGGAMNIREGSRVDMSAVSRGLFSHNKAIFAGGALYADSASTSQLAVEYNHTLAQTIFGTCFIMFGNEPARMGTFPRRFTFVGNSAVAEGQSIHSFSLRGCVVANFVPSVTAQYLLITSDGTVGYDDSSILENTSTGPSNLFFYGASTKCFKTVGNITYLLPNCSHELLNETFYSLPDLQCGLSTFFNDLRAIYTPGTGLRPPLNKLHTPWAGIEASWTLTPRFMREKCVETNPGNLVLSPAPGEEFDLTIQLADQLLNYVSATIYLDILHEVDSPPGVLIQLNGIQFAYNDRVYFTPNRALSGLTLVGLPGTAGKLRVVADSQIMGETIELLIPFQLSQCPMGYFNPPGATTLQEVNDLISTVFSSTQRIPTDQPLACQCFVDNNSTQIFTPRVTSLSTNCIQGYTVELSSILWAGLIPMETGPSLPLVDCPPIPADPPVIDDGNYTTWITQSRILDAANGMRANFDPVDVVPYESGVTPGGGAPVICYATENVSELINYQAPGEFTVDLCTRGYCRGDAESKWFVSDVDFPCSDNREGVLCGQCKTGFAVTLYTTACKDCRNQIWQSVLAVIATLIGGVVLVVVAIAFKLGVSPTMDSMLFFIQTVLILISGRTDYAIFPLFLPFFNPDFTFNLCITPHLTAFVRLILQFVTPLYILILLGVVLALTRYTRISRLLGKHSFLQALWLLFLISYLNIANTSFELLHCKTISSIEGGVTRYSLSHDASVECFKGSHLPTGIVALLLVLLFVLPLPVYVYAAMLFPKMKPVTDVYCSPYSDRRRWWVVISIARRLLLVLVGVFIQDYTWRHFGLLFCIGFIQVVYVATWPYQTRVDNYFGFLVGWMLLLVGLITQPDLYLYIDPSRAVSATAVVLTISISLVLLLFETILRFFDLTVGKFFKNVLSPYYKSFKESLTDYVKRKPPPSDLQELEESTQSSIIPKLGTVDATSYREPLLDSIFASGDTSINSSSRDSLEKTKRGGRAKKGRGSKTDESIEAMPGRHRTTMTLVSPDRGSGYLDSGFAATTYVNGVDQ